MPYRPTLYSKDRRPFAARELSVCRFGLCSGTVPATHQHFVLASVLPVLLLCSKTGGCLIGKECARGLLVHVRILNTRRTDGPLSRALHTQHTPGRQPSGCDGSNLSCRPRSVASDEGLLRLNVGCLVECEASYPDLAKTITGGGSPAVPKTKSGPRWQRSVVSHLYLSEDVVCRI